jgi:predicted Zn-dependent protease with MMP-like domain/DnaJ-domain-containing protein 1
MAEAGEGQQTTDVAEDASTRRGRDYYALLGVAPTAEHDEIRHAFHAAAKQWHPDRYVGASEGERAAAERRMRALIEAYSALADPARRELYDAQRRDHVHAGHAHAGHAAEAARPAASTHAYWEIPAEDTDAYDRLYANNDPRGVASFLGVLLALVALAIFRASLGGGAGIGAFVGLALAIAFGAAALWCFVDPAGLARAAEHLAPRTPPHKAHAPHHRHAAAPQHGENGHQQTTEGEDGEAEFERLVDEAVSSIPDEFKAYMRNVVVRVRAQPTAAERHQMRLREGETLFGLYQGVMLTQQGAAGAGPEVVTIYRRPIERACGGDPERIREQVRRTVLHELAHHFGIDHEDMPEWIR